MRANLFKACGVIDSENFSIGNSDVNDVILGFDFYINNPVNLIDEFKNVLVHVERRADSNMSAQLALNPSTQNSPYYIIYLGPFFSDLRSEMDLHDYRKVYLNNSSYFIVSHTSPCYFRSNNSHLFYRPVKYGKTHAGFAHLAKIEPTITYNNVLVREKV